MSFPLEQYYDKFIQQHLIFLPVLPGGSNKASESALQSLKLFMHDSHSPAMRSELRTLNKQQASLSGCLL